MNKPTAKYIDAKWMPTFVPQHKADSLSSNNFHTEHNENHDLKIMEIHTILIKSLTEARDMIKQTCEKMLDALPFNVDQAGSTVLTAARGVCDHVITNLNLSAHCVGIQKKYGNNHEKVLKNLHKLDERESTAYAMHITLSGMLKRLADQTALNCINRFTELDDQNNFTKTTALQTIRTEADKTCAALARTLIS